MIISLIQTRSRFTCEYKFVHKGNIICNSYIQFKLLKRAVDLVKDNKLLYKVESCPKDDLKRIFNHFPVRKSYLIKDYNSEVCGYISKKCSSFWFGYYYYELMLKGSIYTIYEVGKGREGVFITIYQNDEQVALIHKGTKVINFKDNYIIYLKKEGDLTPVMLFNVLYDSLESGNQGDYGAKSVQYSASYTFSKFVKSTYNPDFIKGIEE